jgi:DNA-directed RNA polymerases I, II, and III subunit RPABC4
MSFTPLSPQLMQPSLSPSQVSSPSQNPFVSHKSSSESEQKEQKQNSVVSVAYICGSCSLENYLKPKDVIRCKECGHRIVYKKRTTKSKKFIF